MTEQLAYLDDVMEKAVARLDDPSQPLPPGLVDMTAIEDVIAGFAIKNKAKLKEAEAAARATRKIQIESYREHRAKLHKKLSLVHVRPHATMPGMAWERLWRASGLFRVPANRLLRINLSSIAGYVGARLDAIRGVSRTILVRESIEVYLAETPYAEFFRQLMDFSSGTSQWYRGTTVTLPEPPQDVVEILVATKGMYPQTVAVPEAFLLAPSPQQLLTEAFREQFHRETTERAARAYRHDPIVYVREGPAVAIVAQFGDFPIEKAMMDRIAGEDLLPQEKGPLQPVSQSWSN